MNFTAQPHAKVVKTGRNRFFLSMNCLDVQFMGYQTSSGADALRRRLRATSVAIQIVIRSHQIKCINHARNTIWDMFNAHYVCYIYIYTYTCIYIYTYKYTQTINIMNIIFITVSIHVASWNYLV